MNYYNEHDIKTAAWLRELIIAGLIPTGDVDERSIAEVQPNELRHYTQCHFFAGIGGWSLALQLAGWPADRPVWTGSCPCQPFSSAGKGLGDKDERHLWPVFFDLIKECRPDAVFGEQVASAIGKGWLDGIQADLESENYACGSAVLGAHSVGAPHIRQRLYWAASLDNWKKVSFAADCLGGDEDEPGDECSICGLSYTDDCKCPWPTQDGYEYTERDGTLYARWMGYTRGEGSQRHGGHVDYGSEPRREYQEPIRPVGKTSWANSNQPICRDGKTRRIPTEPAFFPLAHGVPERVVRLRGYGNAIVPQVAAEFVKAFLES
jgi:DNA (cytosine-5)-methyltransferase 1